MKKTKKVRKKERKKYGMKARCSNITHLTTVAIDRINRPSILWYETWRKINWKKSQEGKQLQTNFTCCT
jgi:hypothetical protein